MCFRNSERISGHKTVMNAEWVCRAEVSITRWKIINTSFGEFHNIWAAANSKQLKSSLDLILRGKTPWELLFVCWNWSLMTLWISEKRRRRLQSVKSKQFSWKNEWHFPNIKVKTNTCYTPLGEGKVLKKTPTYVSLKLKIFWGNVHTYAEILTHPRITL